MFSQIRQGFILLNNEDYLNIFHEIKNSITLVNGSLQLVAKKHPEVCSFDYWDETISEINFLKNMVTQLSSTRLCSHLNFTQVDISSFMKEISSSISASAWDGFVCEIIVEEHIPSVELDPQPLRQAIINIVKNAYEAMEHHGVANIHVTSADNVLHISITDHGGGLDPALADSIFQPFITTKAGGSGLGLAITRQIIEAHHGSLQCTSRPGDGCTFTISLPLKQS